MIPLTGVTMPFVSYGGSSMVTSLALVGVLEGVAIGTSNDNDEEDPSEDSDYEENEYVEETFGEGV